jgi:uncharacterized protein YdaU (DUF1376 family)
VNYFNFHVGDYAAHTAHLTWEEDLIYRRLLDLYYLHERSLTPDVQKLARVIRMPKAVASIEAVLDEFFHLQEDGWHNKRADAELGSMGEKQEMNEERTNHEKDRQKRYRERRSAMFEALRSMGIVPAWDVSMKDLQRLFEQHCNAPATSPETDLQRNGDVSGDGPATAIPTPTPTPSISVPKGTAGKPASEKSKAELWQAAVSLLTEQKMPEPQARSFIGKLAKDYTGEGVVLEAVRAAVAEQPADARAYLKATCQRLNGERKRDGQADWTKEAV